MIRIHVPAVRPFVRCTLKRAVRALPSALLLLFVLSLVLVTLLQIALVHSSHRRPPLLHPRENSTQRPLVASTLPNQQQFQQHKVKPDTLRVEAFLDKAAPTLEGSATIVHNMLNSARVRRIMSGVVGGVARRGGKVGHLAASDKRDDFKWHRRKACPEVPPGLRGRLDLTANLTSDNWSCAPRHRVAIVVPYRDRLEHLQQLLRTLLPVLQRQQLHYRVYVIEQFGNSTFNKGVLMNAGVREALRDSPYDCFVFHDVDMIPEDDRNLYTCSAAAPRHLSVAVDKFNYTLPYALLVGGVFSISLEHYLQVNGYSNLYWGWGGEDDDMAYRIKYRKLEIIRPPETLARYSMIKHHHRPESPNAIRSALLRMAKKRSSRDGLNTVKYRVVRVRETPSYTHVFVDIGSNHRWRFLDHQRLVINF